MLNLATITTQLQQLKVVPVIALDHAEAIFPLADILRQLKRQLAYCANSDRIF